MTQEQLQEQFIQYAENNLQNDTILKSVIELLDNISNELHYNGYIKENNQLTTSTLIIKELLEQGVM